MRPVLFMLAFCAAGSGCEKAFFDDAMRKAVREKLKDPDSAQFGKPLIFKNRGCIEVNSKNSYGGYTGATTAHLKNLGGDSWTVDTLEGRACYSTVLQELQAKDDSETKFENELITILKTQGTVKSTASSLYLLDDKNKCIKFARGIHASFRLSQDDTNTEKQRQDWREQTAKELSILNSGSCPES